MNEGVNERMNEGVDERMNEGMDEGAAQTTQKIGDGTRSNRVKIPFSNLWWRHQASNFWTEKIWRRIIPEIDVLPGEEMCSMEWMERTYNHIHPLILPSIHPSIHPSISAKRSLQSKTKWKMESLQMDRHAWSVKKNWMNTLDRAKVNGGAWKDWSSIDYSMDS